MTKKLHFLLGFIALFLMQMIFVQSAKSQVCTPDPQYTIAGIYPDSATNLPCAVMGSPYSETVTLVVPADTTVVYMGNPIDFWIDSVALLSMNNLPPGLTYSCEPPICSWNGGTTGCLLISGIPTTNGTYNIDVYTRSYVTDKLTGFINTTQDDTTSYYFILVTDSAGCPDTGTGINNLTGAEFTLDQNNPNPFTEKTTINFTSDVSGDVEFTVYNLLGKMVYNRSLKAKTGINSIEFTSKGLPAGIYMFRLQNEAGSATRRMVITNK